MKLLLRMRHGLGDNAQFTIVLRHLHYYFPHWIIDMEVGTGKESYYAHGINKLYRRKKDHYNQKKYDNILDVHWPIPEVCLPDVPSSKPTQFLRGVIRVKPIEKYYRGYDINITDRERELVDDYVNKNLPDRPFVLLHYLAKTLKLQKSLGHKDASFICSQIMSLGYTPVILDWKNESPLPDQKFIYNPGPDCPLWGGADGLVNAHGSRLATGGTIAAFIEKAKLYIGIDSGPLHIAGCTKTPSIGIWHAHHPVNFFDLCDNITHLVPHGNRYKGKKTIRGKGKNLARRYFEKKYDYRYYRILLKGLTELIDDKLN